MRMDLFAHATLSYVLEQNTRISTVISGQFSRRDLKPLAFLVDIELIISKGNSVMVYMDRSLIVGN